MIGTISIFNGSNYLPPIPAIVRGNIALFPSFDEGFIYVLRHVPTGTLITEAGTKEAGLKALRELSALHSWDVDNPNLVEKTVGEEVLHRARTIAREAYNSLPYDDDVLPIYIIRDAIERRMRRGKFVSEELRARTLDQFMEAVEED